MRIRDLDFECKHTLKSSSVPTLITLNLTLSHNLSKKGKNEVNTIETEKKYVSSSVNEHITLHTESKEKMRAKKKKNHK